MCHRMMQTLGFLLWICAILGPGTSVLGANPCASRPCPSGSKAPCVRSAGEPQGYYCDYCRDPSRCSGNGACVNEEGGFRCICYYGYRGKRCRVREDATTGYDFSGLYIRGVNLNPEGPTFSETEPVYLLVDLVQPYDVANFGACMSFPCQNAGECRYTTDYNSYECICRAGSTGKFCETYLDSCLHNPCQNGGRCELEREMKRKDYKQGTPVLHQCVCPAGYFGRSCEIYRTCPYGYCRYGDCEPLASSYSCSCYPGYSGSRCNIDINECASNPCAHGGCADLIAGYTCTCRPGWRGPSCNDTMTECLYDPCVHGRCIGMVNGAFRCECLFGYTGNICDLEKADSGADPGRGHPPVHGVWIPFYVGITVLSGGWRL